MFTRMPNGTHPINRLRNEMDALFENVLNDAPFGFRATRAFPALNVWEDGERFFVEAEVPGMKIEDIELLVVGHEMTVKGERKDARRQGAVYHRRERGVGTFTRTLRLPADVDTDKVEAAMRDGVLTITLPKAETAKARKIEVKVASK